MMPIMDPAAVQMFHPSNSISQPQRPAIPDEVHQLFVKYGLNSSDVQTTNLPKYLVELKRMARNHLSKTMRMKEGLENMRKAVIDNKKQLHNLSLEVRKVNSQIDEIHADLQTLEMYSIGSGSTGMLLKF